MIRGLLAAALASATVTPAPPDIELAHHGVCTADRSGWTCWHGDLQLVATVRPVDRSRAPEDVLRERFVLLGDWPRGSFGPAWAGDTLGWEAHVGDGVRAQLVRWWAVDGALYTVSAVGPAARIDREARDWVEAVRFPPLHAP